MERNPSSVSSQHKSWSLQGQTRPYRSPTSCKVLLLLIAARCISSSCADHIVQVLTSSPRHAQHLAEVFSNCRFHHRPLAYKRNGGWWTAEACVACTRTKVPQHWEEEEKRRKKKRRKREATLCLPCCVCIPNDTIWHHKRGLFIFPLSAQHSFRQASILYFVTIPHSVAEEQAPQWSNHVTQSHVPGETDEPTIL